MLPPRVAQHLVRQLVHLLVFDARGYVLFLLVKDFPDGVEHGVELLFCEAEGCLGGDVLDALGEWKAGWMERLNGGWDEGEEG